MISYFYCLSFSFLPLHYNFYFLNLPARNPYQGYYYVLRPNEGLHILIVNKFYLLLKIYASIIDVWCINAMHSLLRFFYMLFALVSVNCSFNAHFAIMPYNIEWILVPLQFVPQAYLCLVGSNCWDITCYYFKNSITAVSMIELKNYLSKSFNACKVLLTKPDFAALQTTLLFF